MIRNALIIAGASFVLMLGCFAGVAALAGPTILKDGWTIPFDEEGEVIITSNGRQVLNGRHVGMKGGVASPIVSRQFAWSGADILKLDVPSDVEYIQGPVGKIEVSGPKAMVDHLLINGGALQLADNIEGESLTIDRYGVRFQDGADRLKITITAPGVRHFELSGSGDLDIASYDQPSLGVTINGSGDVSANGRTMALDVKTSGSGSAYLDKVTARDATVTVQGSGDVDLSPRDTVKIDISGSGDVSLKSTPASVTSAISGSGSVRQNDD